jgi:hypothetical protein|tara:strand:+ start:622 stop:876 length:255 start_codon:yes stop_codon:yes gene_type:complete
MKITKEYLRDLINEEVKTQQDVEKVKTRLGAVSGLEDLLNKVNSRQEFEQFLREVIKLGSKNVKAQDILISVRNVFTTLKKELK